ncbi:ATP-binding cassette domain-containing protein [Butyrivibrio sp. AE2032]|uniref:ATP-binding cassette domain-containing protein n=1 Tax=Butyrivibrio sp. AE2032 TaxID=1458463 RepID=UPI0005590CBC|nr:ATP-binding cassette domain-containing protein [Butyrivibrio sp. AE2032]
MKETILKTSGLTKCYGKQKALDGIDLTVNRGEICGLIGKNGAGKTTLMKVITGLTCVDNGTFELFGKADVKEERTRIGCIIDSPAFFGNLSAYDNLKYYCILKGITDLTKIGKALECVGLTDTGKKKYRNFSLGMKQRLGIALAILDEPELLILDEPINGLDPIGIADMRELFRKLNKEAGITIVISSHILPELDSLATRFIFIDSGRIVKSLSKEELDDECRVSLNITCDDTSKASTILERYLGIKEYKITDSRTIKIYDPAQEEELRAALEKEGMQILSVESKGVSLEDYFRMIVGDRPESGR